jgi:hypothetical protein
MMQHQGSECNTRLVGIRGDYNGVECTVSEGIAPRSQLMGEALTECMNQTISADPIRKSAVILRQKPCLARYRHGRGSI